MNEGGGTVVKDIANQNNGVFFGGVNYLLSGIKTSTGRIDCTDKGKINPVNGIYSVVFNCSFINIVSPYGGIYAKTTNGVDNSFALGRDEGNDSLKVYHSNVEGLVLTNLKPSSLVQKGYQTVAITNYGYNISAYLNGSLKDTGVISLNSLPGVGNGILKISSERGGTLNYSTDGLWKYFYIYNRVLSPSEIQSLYIAPYQMIAARRRIQIYNIGAGGATNVTVNATKSVVSITALSPTVTAIKNVIVSPSAASVTIRAISPTVATSSTQDVTVNATVSTVKVTALSPTVTAVKNVTVSVTPVSITIKALSPVVDVAGNVTVNASLSRISITSPAVTVTTTSNATVNVSPARISINAISPTVSVVANRTVNVTVSTITIRAISPTVSAQGAASNAGDVILLSSQINKTILHSSQIEKTILHESPLH